MMDAVTSRGEPISDKSLMVDRVMEHVRQKFGGAVDDALLREWTLAAVDRVWGDGPQVTRYVPILALREIQEKVLADRLQGSPTLPPGTARDTLTWDPEHKETDAAA
jgi:hypothetical protein